MHRHMTQAMTDSFHCQYNCSSWVGGRAQQPKSGLRCLIVGISRLQTVRHTHPVGFLWKSDQLVAEPTTYTTHNKQGDEHWCPQQIQNHDPSNQVAADLRLRPCGHQKQHIIPHTIWHKWVHRYYNV